MILKRKHTVYYLISPDYKKTLIVHIFTSCIGIVISALWHRLYVRQSYPMHIYIVQVTVQTLFC